jgi:hypothetical protein
MRTIVQAVAVEILILSLSKDEDFGSVANVDPSLFSFPPVDAPPPGAVGLVSERGEEDA